MVRAFTQLGACLCVVVTLACAPARAQSRTDDASLDALVAAAIDRASQADELHFAVHDLQNLCDRLTVTAPSAAFDKLAIADAPRRVLAGIASAPESEHAALLRSYRDHPEVFESLAYVMRAEPDNPTSAYEELARLASVRPDAVRELPNLVAAVAAVHDPRLVRGVNENLAEASPPEEVLDYFIKHRRSLVLDPATTPAEVLVYVVDSTAKVEELEWARREFRDRAPNLKDCYFRVQYDDEHFSRGTTKRVTASGEFGLPGIWKYGGVCADQAHFAAHVGKAFGVPTAYVGGRGANVGHAWLGQFVVAGRRSAWDFNAGRYDAYKNVRGTVTCPVSNRPVSDGEVALVAELAKYSVAERRAAAALASSAERWALVPPADELAPVPGVRPIREPRPTDRAGQLAVLRFATELCPHDAAPWREMTAVAITQGMTQGELDDWAKTLFAKLGDGYLDFSFETLARMISSVESAEAKIDMWDWAYRKFTRRPDLASRVRFEQAAIWRSEGDLGKAWNAYDDVASRFGNDSADAVTAVRTMLTMLDENGGRQQHAIPMLERVWRSIHQPRQMSPQFASQSNWHRIGALLAAEYQRQGRTGQAEDVRRRLGNR